MQAVISFNIFADAVLVIKSMLHVTKQLFQYA